MNGAISFLDPDGDLHFIHFRLQRCFNEPMGRMFVLAPLWRVATLFILPL